MEMTDRYFIACQKCDKEVSLIEISSDEFQCPSCGTMYTSENGVWDNWIAEDMFRLYKGAKRAGLI